MATNWMGKIIGMKLPDTILNIDWKEISGGGQRYSEDQFGNDWRNEGDRYWTTLASQYRDCISLPTFIDVDEDMIVTSIDVDAYYAAPMGGRPAYIGPQTREVNQVGRLLKTLFGLEKPKAVKGSRLPFFGGCCLHVP